MAKKKQSNSSKIFNPFLLSLAAAAGWAATHTSYNFSSFSMIGAWLLSALAIGLFVRAILALISPILKLGFEVIQYTLSPDNINDRNDI